MLCAGVSVGWLRLCCALYRSAICGAKYSVPQRMAVWMRSCVRGVPGLVNGRRELSSMMGREKSAPMVVCVVVLASGRGLWLETADGGVCG